MDFTCGHTHYVIIYSRFRQNPLRGFGASGCRNLPFSITLAIGFYTMMKWWKLWDFFWTWTTSTLLLLTAALMLWRYSTIQIYYYYYFFTLVLNSQGMKKLCYVLQKVQKSNWNEPYSSSSFTKQSCSKMALYRWIRTESRWNKKLISLLSPDWSASLRPSLERKTRPDALLLLLFILQVV